MANFLARHDLGDTVRFSLPRESHTGKVHSVTFYEEIIKYGVTVQTGKGEEYYELPEGDVSKVASTKGSGGSE